jgi:hypothetical protein
MSTTTITTATTKLITTMTTRTIMTTGTGMHMRRPSPTPRFRLSR